MGKFIKKFNENYEEKLSSSNRELQDLLKNKSDERRNYESDKFAFVFLVKKGEKFPQGGEMTYISDVNDTENLSVSKLMLISSFDNETEFSHKWIPKSLIDTNRIDDDKYQIGDDDTELINFLNN